MDDRVVELYKQCGNGGLVAKKLGLTNYKVYMILRKNGIEPKKIGGKERVALDVLVADYNSGMSTSQVALKHGISAGAIVERFQNHNIPMRSKSEAHALRGYTKITEDREQECIDLYQSGKSSMEVASYFGLKSKDPVLAILKKHNIQARDNFGSNNSAWKGGKVPLNKLIRNSQKYTDFVKHIMSSRNYTCEITGERGGKLNVHHIKPFSRLVDEFMKSHGHIADRQQLMNAIEAYAPFWDEHNVLLLTEIEHKKIHSQD